MSDNDNDLILADDAYEQFELYKIQWSTKDFGWLIRQEILTGEKKNGNTYVSQQSLKELLTFRNKQLQNRMIAVEILV